MEIEELLTCMQNHWNHTICISWLVPEGDKQKPNSGRLEGGTEGPSGIEAQGTKYRPLKRPREHFWARGTWYLSGSPAHPLLDPFGKVAQSHHPGGVLGSSGHWRGVRDWVLSTCPWEVRVPRERPDHGSAETPSPQHMLHCPLRFYIQIANSKIKWLRISRHNHKY